MDGLSYCVVLEIKIPEKVAGQVCCIFVLDVDPRGGVPPSTTEVL